MIPVRLGRMLQYETLATPDQTLLQTANLVND